ncbi:intermembrane phospholipid transport protein YdbH family protein [Sphingopyxis sp.]|uniref:intermembrane phospholipid transport protein YdbH family protein n=1 Tax=Sphingopyxis sp. TaxID=1908224 RepID=UPI003BACE1F3
MSETDGPARPHFRTILFKKRWMTAGAVVALAAALWLAREPIADRVIRDQLDSRGIPASYRIEDIGVRSERLSNLVIGDPAHPDLTAKSVEVSIGYGWSGPYVSGLRADGVRLYGRFVDGQISLGSLDKFRDPADQTPFALPDLWVRLADARARVETPWGNVGAALNGSGNLRKDFLGQLALVAPDIVAAGCAARGTTFYGTVRVRNVRPTLTGPLRGKSVTCADGSVTALSPQIALDVSLSENLQSWRGTVDASIARLAAASLTADRLAAKAAFDGTSAATTIDVDASMAQLRGTDFAANTVAVTAKGVVGSKAPLIDGRLRFTRARASAALQSSIMGSVKGLTGSPVGPVASRAAAALARMIADVGGEAAFALRGEGKDARIDLLAPALASASGARFTGSADSRISYIFGVPAVVANGSWTFGGGDIPSGKLALDRRADGTVSGLASFDAYVAGDARLALAPVRFSGDRSGLLRFATKAELSGPIGDGRVDRLSIPLAGALAPTGALALNGGCTRVGVDRLAVSGFRIGATGIDLCSSAGAPLLSAGPGGLRGTVRIPAVRLRGTSGSSPFALDARNGEIDLASLRWAVALADVRLGQGDGVTRFAAKRIAGRSTPQGMAGELAGASGKIGPVPLNMSDIGGQWRWAGGALTLNGGLVLTDADPDPRFSPLASHDAKLRFAGGVIDATAGFHEQKSGTKILDTVIRHRLGDGSGTADLFVRELRFNDNFQPDQLTHLAYGVVANAQGSVVGDGHIAWSPQGVTSRGTFATANMDLAAAFGPVTGLTTTLVFDDLIGLKTAPGQKARVGSINPGIPVLDGEIEYELLGDNRVRVEGGRWPFAGGELLLHPTTLNFAADQPRRLTFDLVGVDAAIFLQNFGFDNINATGKFDGTLPVVFDGLGGRIENGRIDARGGGGTLAYGGELSNHNLGAIANFAFGALRSLKYDDLTIVLNGDLDGEMVTDIRFGGVGQGEGATRNILTRQIAKIPLVFNVKITAAFRELLGSARSYYDPTGWLKDNLQEIMEREAAANASPPSVQAPESELVQ